MKKSFLMIAFAGMFLASQAQLEKIKEVWYKPVVFENEVAKIYLVDIIATNEFSKFKIKFDNKTADYLIFRPSECVFIFPWGEMKPANKNNVIIRPYGDASRVLEVVGDARAKCEEYQFVTGDLLRVSAEGTPQSAPDFALPPSNYDFKTSDFTCKVQKIKKETDITMVPVSCTYNGGDYGIITPSKAVCKIEAGQEFAVANPGVKGALLERGQDDKFTIDFKIPAKVVDMQFANMTVVWKGTFASSKATKIPMQPFAVKYDAGLTQGKK